MLDTLLTVARFTLRATAVMLIGAGMLVQLLVIFLTALVQLMDEPVTESVTEQVTVDDSVTVIEFGTLTWNELRSLAKSHNIKARKKVDIITALTAIQLT